MLGDATTKIMTEKEKREFREKEFKDIEKLEREREYEFAVKELSKHSARKKDFKAKTDHIIDQSTRKWIIKQGKGDLLDFKDDEIHKLKACFNSLDCDSSGSIGVQELLEPLIGLGFADREEEVERMVDLVDKDKSNQIEFQEFIELIKNAGGDEKTRAITKFFRDLNNGAYGNRDVSFSLFVKQERRQHLIDAIKETSNKEKREKGRRIMENVKLLLNKEQEA